MSDLPSWDAEGKSPWSNPAFREAVRREDDAYRHAAQGTTRMVTEEAMLGWQQRAIAAERRAEHWEAEAMRHCDNIAFWRERAERIEQELQRSDREWFAKLTAADESWKAAEQRAERAEQALDTAHAVRDMLSTRLERALVAGAESRERAERLAGLLMEARNEIEHYAGCPQDMITPSGPCDCFAGQLLARIDAEAS